MTRRRRLLILFLLTVLVIGTIIMGVRRYLASQQFAGEVRTRVQAAYGGTVQVGSVEMGLAGGSLRDLTFFEAGDSLADTPLATVEEADSDLSLWDLLLGRTLPKTVTVTGAVIRLRFAADGQLTTRLPARAAAGTELPEIRLHKSVLLLCQQGRPEMTLHDVDATLRPSASGALRLEGTLADRYWGNWSFAGTLGPGTHAVALDLKTPRLHITQAMLDALPFVSPGVWEQVQFEGDSPVDLSFRVDPGGDGVHYRVALEPEATKVHVKSIDLHADETRGKVVIEDKLVHLERVRGQAAQGQIETTARLDFRAIPDRLRFAIRVTRMLLSNLPASWRVPRQVDGRLTGKADLLVTIQNGKSRTDGEGDGVVDEARLKGPLNPRIPSIPLRLRADEKGFHFAPAHRDMRGGSTGQAPIHCRGEKRLLLVEPLAGD